MMRNTTFSFTALVAACLFSAPAWGLCPQDEKSSTELVKGKAPCNGSKVVTVADKITPCGNDCTKPCCKKGDGAPASAGSQGGCPIGKKIDAVLASVPEMKYRVGDTVTGCSHSAGSMAEKSGQAVQFVVGDEVFQTEADATARLIALYEKEIEALTSVQYSVGGECVRCPVTAKSMAKKGNAKVAYRVGTFDFAEKAQAEETVKLVSDAAAGVKVSYKVGDKSFCCDKMASASQKETGAKMTYVVGDVPAQNELAAKVLLAQAKIRAIIKTAASTGS